MSFLIVKKLGGQVQASIHVPTRKTVSQVVIVYEDGTSDVQYKMLQQKDRANSTTKVSKLNDFYFNILLYRTRTYCFPFYFEFKRTKKKTIHVYTYYIHAYIVEIRSISQQPPLRKKSSREHTLLYVINNRAARFRTISQTTRCNDRDGTGKKKKEGKRFSAGVKYILYGSNLLWVKKN